MNLRFALLAVTLASLVTHAASVRAQTALELTDRARKELQAFDDAKKAEIKKAEDARRENPAADMSNVGADHQESFALGQALNTIQRVRTSLASGDDADALLELGHIAPFGNLPRELQPVLDALGQRVRTDQREKADAYAKDVDATCQRAAAAILPAKEARDLDDTLKDLKRAADLPAPATGHSSDGRNDAVRLRYAISFVTHWQDYLIACSRNDDTEARNILRNLTNETNVPLVARSEILARIPQTGSERDNALRVRREQSGRSQVQIDLDAREIIRGLHRLDEVAPALARLVDLRTEETQLTRNYRSDSVLNAALEGMETLERGILEFRNGFTPNLGRLLSRTEYATHPEINLALWSLRMQLVREAAPHFMGVSADEKPVSDDEPAGVYIHRLVESSKARQDWAAVIQGLQILRMLSAPDSVSYGSGNELDTTVYQNLLSADDLEKAGQYSDAVAMYLTVLHVGQPGLPAAWIGQHLADIQKAHPDEYKRARGLTPEESRAAYIKTLRDYRNEFGTLMSDPTVEATATVPAPSPTPGASPSPSATVAATPTPAP